MHVTIHFGLSSWKSLVFLNPLYRRVKRQEPGLDFYSRHFFMKEGMFFFPSRKGGENNEKSWLIAEDLLLWTRAEKVQIG